MATGRLKTFQTAFAFDMTEYFSKPRKVNLPKLMAVCLIWRRQPAAGWLKAGVISALNQPELFL
ncbi:hypothetical protein [Neisseria dentiae]|uniref:hypothetical protein n=1 Tax=Neisseria dentiae TaxID=194197 RepID=UPI0011C05EDA|nr:hypothetical protein [Neisseria dentiae]